MDAKRTRCRTSEIAGWVGVVVARRDDTLTHTPLRLMNRPRLTAGFCLWFSGWRVGSGRKSGDMPTRLPWRHLAAKGGMMRSAFSECAKTTHSGSCRGPTGGGWACGLQRPCGGTDTDSSSWRADAPEAQDEVADRLGEASAVVLRTMAGQVAESGRPHHLEPGLCPG